MLRISKIILVFILVGLFHGSLHIQQHSPLIVDETDILTGWDYEMQSWWPPFEYDGKIWVVYGEWNFGNQQILKIKTYNGEWSDSQILTPDGEFLTQIESSDGLLFFWIESARDESAVTETICQRAYTNEWSSPLCSETAFNVGNHFMVETPEGIMLIWSRSGFWEYQLYETGGWKEKEVLSSTEGYHRLLKVLYHADSLWVFYESGTSDISYRVFGDNESQESIPFITEGFPYIYSVCSYNNSLMMFLEIQEKGSTGKTLAYTHYNGKWSSLQAVAGPENGYLSGGLPLVTEDGQVFVFWNGSDANSDLADLYYRVYDGNWSPIYRLTDTPDMWESTGTVTQYGDTFLILWREKNTRQVYATTAHHTDTSLEYSDGLRAVTLKEEPVDVNRNIYRIQRYIAPLMVIITICAIGAIIIMKRKNISGSKKKSRKK